MPTPNVSYWEVWRKLRDDVIYVTKDAMLYQEADIRTEQLQIVYDGPILDPLGHPFRHDR